MATDIVARGMAASKLDKNGGEISGNLSISGDLYVSGTTVTTQEEHLLISDKIIVTNSNGATLSGLSGIAIKTNSADSYGIMYDSVSNDLKIGNGTLDANNNFSFNADSGNLILTLNDSQRLSDTSIIQWNSSNKEFENIGIFEDSNSLLPTSAGYNLGSNSVLFGTIYVNGISDGANAYSLPNSSGTIALLSDIDQAIGDITNALEILNNGSGV